MRRKPLPLRTVEFQKAMSSLFKLSGLKSMQIAEKLYNSGYISYPRTETDIYDDKFDFKGLLEPQTTDAVFGEYIRNLLERGYDRPRRGKNNDHAHPPIHPLKCGNDLQGNERKVFEYISRRFAACLSRNASFLETKLILEAGGEEFRVIGEEILERNYLEIYIYDKFTEKIVGNIPEGAVLNISKVHMRNGLTSPPSLLSESELISIMDKNGIGTDATIHEHITKVLSRGYAVNDNGKFFPTYLGLGLVLGHDMFSSELILTKPKLRADLEKDLQRICGNLASSATVTANHVTVFRSLVRSIDDNFRYILGSVNFYLGNSSLNLPSAKLENEAGDAKPDVRKNRKSSGRNVRRVRSARGPTNSAKGRHTDGDDDDVRCECGLIAVRLTSQKDASYGKVFFVCSKKVYRCNFFKWE